MKTLFFFSLLLTVTAGCALLGPQPTAFDRALFNVTTNQVTDGTNIVQSYSYAEKPAAVGTLQTAGNVIGAPWGLGGLLGGALIGVYHLFASARNRKVAGALVQGIETAKEVLKTTPQGQMAAQSFTSWLVTHQAQAGVIGTVSNLVDELVDTPKAALDAKTITVDPPARP